MAKKSHNVSNDQSNGQGERIEYQLVKGEYDIVPSRVYTLKNLAVVDGDGKTVMRDAPESALTDGVDERTGSKIYLYRGASPVPKMRRVNSIDEIGQAVSEYLAAVELYDRSTVIVKPDGTDASKAMKVRLAVDKDGETPVSTLDYFYTIVNNAPRLSVQKQMQKALRPQAEDGVRAALGWEAPIGAPKRTPKEKVVVDNDDLI